jgi:hypothetical protein
MTFTNVTYARRIGMYVSKMKKYFYCINNGGISNSSSMHKQIEHFTIRYLVHQFWIIISNVK